MITYYIYILWDKNENDVFYVGVTKNIKIRMAQHRSTNRNPERSFNCSVIDEIQCEIGCNYYFDIEKYWIEQFRQWGFNLTNSKFDFYKPYAIAKPTVKKIYRSLLLKNIPPDVMDFILEKQKEYKNESLTGRCSLQETVIKLISEHRELFEGQTKCA